MRLIDIINGPWAITPDMLAEIQNIYSLHMRGEKIDIGALEARMGAPLNNEAKGYTITDGVAVLQIDGVVSQRMNLFSKISGGTSSQLVAADFQALVADRSVEAIVLAIDSPGGTVAGSPELAQSIYEARDVKPIFSFTDNVMASAAYWFGSAAHVVNISSNVTRVGSIGVIGNHIDTSKADEAEGKKYTEIYAGKYKTVGSPHRALTAEDLAVLQESVDHSYSVFVEDVAKFRDTSIEDVISRMAEGRVFHGHKAIDAGLVDGVATLSETIQQARAMARSENRNSLAGVVRAKLLTEEHAIMNIEQLKAEHPELVQAIVDENQTATAEAVAAATLTGAESERARITDVRAQSIPGHEALIEQLAFDGQSTGADAALAIVGAEKTLRKGALAAIEEEAAELVDASDDSGVAGSMKRAAFNALDHSARSAHLAAGGTIVD